MSAESHQPSTRHPADGPACTSLDCDRTTTLELVEDDRGNEILVCRSHRKEVLGVSS